MAIYNMIYSKKKWEQVNKYNKNLLNDFILEMRSNKKKEGTINIYVSNIRIVFIYILEELDNKPIYKLKKKHFRNFMLWLQDKDMSPARINNIFSALRTMLEYASNEEDYEDELEINYASKVKGLQKEAVRDIVFLTDKEIEIIYKYLIKHKKYNQALFCAIMYDSAARRSEVFQLKRDDISEDTKVSKSYVVGKRGKKYRPIFHDRTREAYAKYMKTRKDDSNELWLSKDGEPITKATLYVWVRTWRNILKRETGEYKKFNPHSFRHSALENYSDGSHYYAKKIGKKFNLETLQLLANHSDISTTQGYLKDKSEDLLLEEFGI